MEIIKLLKNIILILIIVINTTNCSINLKISRRWPTEEPLRITLLRSLTQAKRAKQGQLPIYFDELSRFRKMQKEIDILMEDIFGEVQVN
ncbi:MAG: hypothetical protein K2X90_03310 [Candidatus Babeliaceae bacterium]|nr:hypothetical protein [Candidatus Babeliaceae bacterium]